ncbi:MAG: hypothetical protein SGCHY_005610 [Lobulomycetales sp.]
MDNTCNIFAAKHFPNLGPHVNSAYTKFFKEKFTTEIKSFLSNGNSALRYAGKRFDIEPGDLAKLAFKHEAKFFPAYLPYETTFPLCREGEQLWEKGTAAARDLTRFLQPLPDQVRSKFVLYGFIRKGGRTLIEDNAQADDPDQAKSKGKGKEKDTGNAKAKPKGKGKEDHSKSKSSLKFVFTNPLEKILLTRENGAVFSDIQYSFQSGEIVFKHGRLHVNIKLQEKHIFKATVNPPPDPGPSSDKPPDPGPSSDKPPYPCPSSDKPPDPCPSSDKPPDPGPSSDKSPDPGPITGIPGLLGSIGDDRTVSDIGQTAREAATKRKLKKAWKKFGLRRLDVTVDHIPEPLKKQMHTFGTNILIRKGPGPRNPDDPLRPALQFNLGVDPNQTTFLVAANPWNGDEFWIGYLDGEAIGKHHDSINSIKSEIGLQVDKKQKVLTAKEQYNAVKKAYFRDPGKDTFKKYTEAKSAFLKFKAEETKDATKNRQDELDGLWSRIRHLRDKLHDIASNFLSHWDIVAIPRLKLHDLISRSRSSQLHDRSKFILSMLAHCSFLNRLQTTCEKRYCNQVEVSEASSSKLCSHCRATNSPRRSRLYHCRQCKRTMTRDGNAAMNIIIMALVAVARTVRYRLDDEELCGDHTWNDYEGDQFLEGDIITYNAAQDTLAVDRALGDVNDDRYTQMTETVDVVDDQDNEDTPMTDTVDDVIGASQIGAMGRNIQGIGGSSAGGGERRVRRKRKRSAPDDEVELPDERMQERTDERIQTVCESLKGGRKERETTNNLAIEPGTLQSSNVESNRLCEGTLKKQRRQPRTVQKDIDLGSIS